MRPLEDFCCQHSSCPDYGPRGAGNLRWHGWSSKKNQIRMLYCRRCGTYFSERKGSALWQSRLPENQARIGAGAHCRRVQGAPDGPPGEGSPRYGRPPESTSGGSCGTHP